MIEQIIGYSREKVAGRLREIFAPLEARLNKGDEFDYANFALFDGTLNGDREGIIRVPLTEGSPSRVLDWRLGKDVLLKDVSPLPWAGYLILEPNECFSHLRPGEPTLAFLVDAEEAGRDRTEDWAVIQWVNVYGEVVKESPECSKQLGVYGKDAMEYCTHRGNQKWHAITCTSTGTNQN